MNIKDFLIENYIWLIVIVLITIVTIIGFLADKKRGTKKDKKESQTMPQSMNNQPVMGQPVNNQIPIQYQQPQEMQTNQMNNNIGMNYNNMNTTVKPLNQINNGTVEQQPMIYTQPQAVQSMTNPQPVENVAPNVVQEPMYQPLSEQKPVIAPQPVPNFSSMAAPVNTEINNPQPMPVNSVQSENNTTNVIPTILPTTSPQTNNAIPEQPQGYQNQTYNPQMQMAENNGYGVTPNFIPNNTTIPQSVNQIPVPQPVNPQPIVQGNYNSVVGMPQANNPVETVNNQQPSEQSNTNITQPTQNTIPQPINFVYGTQNNNQNM